MLFRGPEPKAGAQGLGPGQGDGRARAVVPLLSRLSPHVAERGVPLDVYALTVAEPSIGRPGIRNHIGRDQEILGGPGEVEGKILLSIPEDIRRNPEGLSGRALDEAQEIRQDTTHSNVVLCPSFVSVHRTAGSALHIHGRENHSGEAQKLGHGDGRADETGNVARGVDVGSVVAEDALGRDVANRDGSVLNGWEAHN